MRRLRGTCRRGAAAATLCALALALTACGTGRADGTDTEATRAARLDAGSVTPSPSKAGTGTEDPAFLRFMNLLVSVEEPCTKSLPAPTSPEEPDATPPTTPPTDLSLPVGPSPTSEPRDPADAKKGLELEASEKCAATLHAHRITRALRGTSSTTPPQVKRVLNHLGYIDGQMRGPRLAGSAVQFTLDLRVMDGLLCLSGSTDGRKTTIRPYAVSPELNCR
jgi:hypothetical protein